MTLFAITAALTMAFAVVAHHSFRRTVQDVCSVLATTCLGLATVAAAAHLFAEPTPWWVWALTGAYGFSVELRAVRRRRELVRLGGRS